MAILRTPGRRSHFRTPFKHACQRLGRSHIFSVIADSFSVTASHYCEASRLSQRRTRERWQFYPWALNQSRISSGTGFATTTTTTERRRPRVRREHQQPCDCHERFRAPLLTSALFSPSEITITQLIATRNCFSLTANIVNSFFGVDLKLGMPQFLDLAGIPNYIGSVERGERNISSNVTRIEVAQGVGVETLVARTPPKDEA